MGDESKQTEFEHGNTDPLHATRKPSTAEHVDEQASELAQVPKSPDELPRNDDRDRR
jgi:hypothetical protein